MTGCLDLIVQWSRYGKCIGNPPLSVSPYMLCPLPFRLYSFSASRAISGNTTRATARPTYSATSVLATARAAATQHNTSVQHSTTQHNTATHQSWPPPVPLEYSTTRQYNTTKHNTSVQHSTTQHQASVQRTTTQHSTAPQHNKIKVRL